MGRREELLKDLASPPSLGWSDERLALIHAERQALALEGIEDLLRARNEPAFLVGQYGGTTAPPQPSLKTSSALIAVTKNAMPTEAWGKAAFAVGDKGDSVVVCGLGLVFTVEESTGRGKLVFAHKLAALLNRHWGE